MKRNKLYILLSILTIIFFFAVAATCNQCKATAVEEIDVGEKAEEEDEEEEEAAAEEEPAEEEEEEEEAEEEDEEEAEEKEAPTIELEIYQDATLEGSICYCRVKAVVTGNPTPDIDWTKDDSSGSFGDTIAQVNINDPGETFTLSATATNSEGTDTASIPLSWGCNRNPVIDDITIPVSELYVERKYNISATASDSDGDTLTYQWSATGGTINNASANPIEWTAPGSEGSYTLELTVSDGNGGETSESKTVDVKPPKSIDVARIESEGGWLEESGFSNPGGLVCIGDIPGGFSCRGFVSFDISGYSNAIIKSATLILSPRAEWGDTSFFNLIRIDRVEWGSVPIEFAFFNTTGEFIQGFANPNITCTINQLKTELQDAVSAGKSRFQIRVYCTPSSDGDGIADGWEYNQSDVILKIEYIP